MSLFHELKAQLRQLGLDHVPLHALEMAELDREQKQAIRDKDKALQDEFLRYLAYDHVVELNTIGIGPEGLKMMKSGRCPENYCVHRKLPLSARKVQGFSNMVLMQARPWHLNFHRFINPQLTRQRSGGDRWHVFVPVPVGLVFIPATDSRERDDENAMADRMTPDRNLDKRLAKKRGAKKPMLWMLKKKAKKGK